MTICAADKPVPTKRGTDWCRGTRIGSIRSARVRGTCVTTFFRCVLYAPVLTV